MATKKCPQCAEDIQKEARICKHCKTDLSLQENKPEPPKEKKKARLLLCIAIGIGAIIALSLFVQYPLLGFAILLISVWLVPRNRQEKWFQNRLKDYKNYRGRIGLSIGVIALFVLWGIGTISQMAESARLQEQNAKIAAQNEVERKKQQALYDAAPQPKITLLSKEGNQGKALEYELKFSVTGADTVLVNKEEIQAENGVFSKKIPLEKTYNYVTIAAKNQYKDDALRIEVSRDKTPEEIKVEEEQMKEDRLNEMRKSPLNYIEIVKESWYLGGFGSIPIHTITFKNKAQVDYSNIEIEAKYYANSGDLLDSKTYTIYDILPANSTKTFKDINMGFTNNQVTKSHVEITGAVWHQ